jgi:hypothetical protein
MKCFSALLFALAACLMAAPSWAIEPSTDYYKIKGYSPEFIRFANVNQQRMEWKEPPPPPLTPGKQMVRNFVRGRWVESMDPFGYNIIRD